MPNRAKAFCAILKKSSGGFCLFFEGGYVVFCTQCGTAIRDAQHFCWNCGAKAEVPTHVSVASKRQTLSVPSGSNAASTSTKSFGRLFGLDPRVAVLSLIVDMMLNAGDIASMGLLLPVSIMAGAV